MQKVLTIAGSDSWGGGGLQTDLKTMENLEVFGLCAITCIAVEEQNAFKIEGLPLTLLEQQLTTIGTATTLHAIKIGLLHSVEAIAIVQAFCQQFPHLPIVLDPVLAFKETSSAYEKQYAEEMLTLAQLATITTPNLREAQLLTDSPVITTSKQQEQAARQIFDHTKRPVIVKGGTGIVGEEAIDCFFDGKEVRWYRTKKSPKTTVNGAGCCFASAIASHLAKGWTLEDSLQASKQFVFEAIEQGIILNEQFGNVWHPKKEENE